MTYYLMRDLERVLEYLPVSLAAGAVAAVFFLSWESLRRGRWKWKKVFRVFFLAAYLTGMVGLTLLNREEGSRIGISLIPFETWSSNVRDVLFVIENILLFIPFGILVPGLCRGMDRWPILLRTAFLVTAGIEVIQLFTGRGYFQVDDIVNNFVGAALGYGILQGMRKIRAAKKENS
ncbi:MAG: VanZ family protein [Eubacteriales bacterium]|nr:VanZ family protein [Eubacteriales bacterium]